MSESESGELPRREAENCERGTSEMKSRKLRVRGSSVLALVGVSLGGATASAATLTVSNGSAPCPDATYATIQSAIDAASPHDEVQVCAGTYAEQITIAAGKDGLVVRSREPLAAVIQAPATMADPGDIVRINAAHGVSLQGFTIAGPLPDALFCSAFPRTGIRVDGGGFAIVRANRIVDVRSTNPALRGCQNGVPILVGSQPEGEIGSAYIDHNTIEAYEKTGILVDNAGSSAVIIGNAIAGDGPSETIAQNGIQVSNGATADVSTNEVWGQVYSPSPLGSGILFYLPGRVSAEGNVVHNADYGLVTVDAPAPILEHNTAFACTVDGIDVDESVTGTSGALIVANESRDNGLVGIYVSASSKSGVLDSNVMSGDAQFDARDDSSGQGTAGTANVWAHDRCKTDNHGGRLCEPLP